MASARLKGSPWLNDWLAEQIVNDLGPSGALNRTSGPMRKAVIRVIAARTMEFDESKAEPDYPLGYMQGRGAA